MTDQTRVDGQACDDRAELLVRIVSDEPRFSRVDATVPLDLKTIVLKAMVKEPAENEATAAELRADLQLHTHLRKGKACNLPCQPPESI